LGFSNYNLCSGRTFSWAKFDCNFININEIWSKGRFLECGWTWIAIFIYALSTGLGISFLLGTENNFFFFIKLGGALLLLWMGTSMIISAKNTNTDIRKPQAPKNLFFAFRNGFLIGLLNPKVAAFFTSLFTQFVSPSQPISTSLLMATTVSLIDMAAYCVAVFVSNSLLVKHLFLNYTRARERILGLLLLILAFSFIYESVF